MVKSKWKLDIRELPYEELGSLIKAARPITLPSHWPITGPRRI